MLYTAFNYKSKVENCAHLSSLELADCSEDTGPDTIDVLIGSDYYCNFVSGEVHRGKEGPVAVWSMLGWLLSGGIDSTQGGGETYTHK